MNCRACNKILPEITNRIPSYFGSTFFEIARCQCGCSQVSVNCAVDEDIYNRIYSNPILYGYGRYLDYSDTVKKKKFPLDYLSGIEDTYFGIRMSIEKHLNKESTILEVGSGLGYTTYALRAAGYEVVGFDISKESVEKANESFGNYFKCVDISEEKNNATEFYDAIICSEVLEHIDAPYDFLKNCFKYLRPNGLLILTTPNSTDYSGNVIWKSSLPPVHISWFSVNSIKYLVERAGGRILEIMDLSNYYLKNPEFDYNTNNFKVYDDCSGVLAFQSKNRFSFKKRLISLPYFGFYLLKVYRFFRRDVMIFGESKNSKVIVSVIQVSH
jgi:SAM-dependent methyltransferase